MQALNKLVTDGAITMDERIALGAALTELRIKLRESPDYAEYFKRHYGNIAYMVIRRGW